MKKLLLIGLCLLLLTAAVPAAIEGGIVDVAIAEAPDAMGGCIVVPQASLHYDSVSRNCAGKNGNWPICIYRRACHL